MSRKGNSTMDPSCTSESGDLVHPQTGFADKSSTLKPSDKSVYDSRHSDSGVWSGSNIQSEEINVLDSPVSGSFSYSSDKLSSDNKPFMRLDSGIDVSVSQQLSELSLKDVETYNDLSKVPSITTNINEQTSRSQKSPPQKQTLTKEQTLLDICFQQNEDGDTELHLAIIHKFIETVYALVRMVPHPTFLDLKNDDHQTPLHLAVLTQQPRLVRLLVCAGASLEELDRYGNSALHLAVLADNLAFVRAIMDPVTIPETVQAQLQYSPHQFRSNRDIRDVANTFNYEGQSCIHLAALNGSIDIFRHLLWSGANINAKEWKGGQTCLHIAVERRDLALCMFLLSQEGLDADETSYAGHTAYQTACRDYRDLGIVAALRQHGVDSFDSDSEDDDMIDVPENSFASGFSVAGGMVGVGA